MYLQDFLLPILTNLFLILTYYKVVVLYLSFMFSFLNSIRKKRNLELNFVLSEEDKFSWQFSNKGFFNFKNNIPKILTNFNLQ